MKTPLPATFEAVAGQAVVHAAHNYVLVGSLEATWLGGQGDLVARGRADSTGEREVKITFLHCVLLSLENLFCVPNFHLEYGNFYYIFL